MEPDIALIGVAPAASAEPLLAAMARIEGPAPGLHRAGRIAVIFQAATVKRRRVALRRADRSALLRPLHSLQRRLEIACLAGPFLPFDPAAAACARAELTLLVDAAAEALAAALERDGARHQWDIVIRWRPEAVLARHRATLQGRADLAEAIAAVLHEDRAARQGALLAALGPRVLAIADALPAGTEGEASATVLVPAGEEVRIEAALQALPEAIKEGAEADLRGPLPPISFAPLRVTALETATLDAAWHVLDLPDRLDGDALTGRWRAVARRLHPDLAGHRADPERLEAAGRAYRLLRGLAREGNLDRAAVQAMAGRRLSIPNAEVA